MSQDLPSPHGSEASYELPADASFFGGLVVDRRVNRTQAWIVFIFILCGAAVGPALVDDGHGWAMLAGAVVGMIVGTLVSSVVLLFIRRPRPAPSRITLSQARRQLPQLRVLARVALAANILVRSSILWLLPLILGKGWLWDFEFLIAYFICAPVVGMWSHSVSERRRVIERILRVSSPHAGLP